MGRAPCCSKVGLRTGPWSATEDTLLTNYIRVHGEGHWRNLPKRAGLLRCGKSCRLRWMNYLRPDIKRGNISSDEEDLIIRLHSLLGNRWSLIAKRLPGRTDNEIKNYWNSNLSKRVETSRVTRPKAARVVKKKNQSTNGKKQKSNNDDNDSSNTANEEITKTKIYLPKAVKVSPNSFAIRSTGFDNIGSGSSSPSDVGKNITRSNYTNPVSWWPDLLEEKATNSEMGGSCRNGEPSLANYGSDFSFLDFVPIEGNMLDEIIGEYQQLLNFEENVQLDSFEDLLSV